MFLKQEVKRLVLFIDNFQILKLFTHNQHYFIYGVFYTSLV